MGEISRKGSSEGTGITRGAWCDEACVYVGAPRTKVLLAEYAKLEAMDIIGHIRPRVAYRIEDRCRVAQGGLD